MDMLFIACSLLLLAVGFLILVTFRWLYLNPKVSYQNAAAFLVLGDIGRSPRMQNHATAAAEFTSKDTKIYLVGYNQSLCHPSVLNNSKIEILALAERAELDSFKLKWGGAAFPLYAMMKIIHQTIALIVSLIQIPKLRILVVQNPPSFPTLAVCLVICRVKGTKLYVDWHNYGYSLLKMTVSAFKVLKVLKLVEVAEFMEKHFGRAADAHFCVSKAMQEDLCKRWKIDATVLYDCPSDQIRPLSLFERHALLYAYFGALDIRSSLFLEPEVNLSNIKYSAIQYGPKIGTYVLDTSPTYLCKSLSNQQSASIWNSTFLDSFNSCFTEVSVSTELRIEKLDRSMISVSCATREGRLAVIITATSWTPDEDMDLLLKALCLYDSEYELRQLQGSLPELLLIATGKGPQKQSWLKRFADTKMRHVTVKTLFAPMEDYYKLLACSDIGICLHFSSSGVDLPMKVVDMLGAGLPVLAYAFPALDELVKENKNALVFTSAESLCKRLQELLGHYPRLFDLHIGKESHFESTNDLLYEMRLFAESNRPHNFNEEWVNAFKPVLRKTSHTHCLLRKLEELVDCK